MSYEGLNYIGICADHNFVSCGFAVMVWMVVGWTVKLSWLSKRFGWQNGSGAFLTGSNASYFACIVEGSARDMARCLVNNLASCKYGIWCFAMYCSAVAKNLNAVLTKVMYCVRYSTVSGTFTLGRVKEIKGLSFRIGFLGYSEVW